MNYLEICGVILHVSIALCILFIIFAFRNATDYENDPDTFYKDKTREKRSIDLKTMIEGEALVAENEWKESQITFKDLDNLDNI